MKLGRKSASAADYLIRRKVALRACVPAARLRPGEPIPDRLAFPASRVSCPPAQVDVTGDDAVQERDVAHGRYELFPQGTVPSGALAEPAARDDARAELDAIIAKHGYGLTADELAYVLDQFPVLERREVKAAFGSFVTKERVLAKYGEV